MDINAIFLEDLKSKILDAFNNHIMQINKVNINEIYHSREDLINMLEQEEIYLKQKRDAILDEINRFIANGYCE